MPARFTNLRPAEAKPIDRLRVLHTPLYADDETSAFCDEIIDAGLPAGIALAAARIASPEFGARAEHAVRGDLASGSSLGAPSFVALARLLARTKRETLADEVRRGELSPDLAAHIAAIVGKTPPIRSSGNATSMARGAAAASLASDDLLSLYLVPGAYADYRRVLGSLRKLTGLATRSSQDLGRQLLPRPKAVGPRRQSPWPNNEVPFAWNAFLSGRILLPAGVAYRHPSDPGAGARGIAMSDALARSGLSPADIRRIESIASGTAAAARAGPVTTVTTPAAESKVAGKDRTDLS